MQALLSTAHLQTSQPPVTESYNRSALKPKTNNIKGKMNEHSGWQSAPRAGKGVYVKPLQNLDPPLKTQSSSQHRELSAEEKPRDQKQCPRSHVPAEHFAQSKRLWERSPWFPYLGYQGRSNVPLEASSKRRVTVSAGAGDAKTASKRKRQNKL